ncbi:MAG: hypothetical protein IE928_04520, partial [Gammaproteobacteria bacterium]|nr:hypothetical protein [Gammaproteobacteria bacterium]
MNAQHLTLSFPDLTAHIIQARLEITLNQPQILTLQLPRWIPGSYLLRDFTKHLTIH